MKPKLRRLSFAVMLLALLHFPAATEGQSNQTQEIVIRATPKPEPKPEGAALDPKRLEQQKRIVLATNVPPSTQATNGAWLGKTQFYWGAAWRGWEGLHLEYTRRSEAGGPMNWMLHSWGATNRFLYLDEDKLTANLGANVNVDAAAFVTSGNLQGFDNGIELRRLRLYAQGDCILLLPVSYRLEVGYVPDSFYIEESYLAFPSLGFLGTLKLGQFRTPFSLDNITSSRNTAFMEVASPVSALAPGVNAGLEISRSIFNQRMTWAAGLFTPGAGGDVGDASKDYGRAIFRLTGLPIYEEKPDDPTAHRLLHLGLGANWVYSSSGSIRYRTRPESHLAPYVIDTGAMAANNAVMFNAEAAWIRGRLSVQSEYLFGEVNDSQAGRPLFHGFYAQAGWFLTRDTRAYNRSDASLGRIQPRRPFEFKQGGWGAWEVLGRISYTDLSDQAVHGGRLALLSGGLNWFPHSHIRCTINYITGQSSGAHHGWMNIFETRLGVDF